jgi:ATP-dependent Clp protease adaptor protein ClpS
MVPTERDHRGCGRKEPFFVVVTNATDGASRIARLPARLGRIKTNRMGEAERHTGGEVLERTRQETKKPELFKVLLLNDDYTTMDFVVEVLENVFNKAPAEAYRIMMAVHTQGQGLCGVYPYEVAETKVATVVDLARSHGFPLRAAMEPE